MIRACDPLLRYREGRGKQIDVKTQRSAFHSRLRPLHPAPSALLTPAPHPQSAWLTSQRTSAKQ